MECKLFNGNIYGMLSRCSKVVAKLVVHTLSTELYEIITLDSVETRSAARLVDSSDSRAAGEGRCIRSSLPSKPVKVRQNNFYYGQYQKWLISFQPHHNTQLVSTVNYQIKICRIH